MHGAVAFMFTELYLSIQMSFHSTTIACGRRHVHVMGLALTDCSLVSDATVLTNKYTCMECLTKCTLLPLGSSNGG